MTAKGKIIAIVPAAGIGKRFGEGRNKPFHELAGKPLLIWTLEALNAVDEIDEIIPVLKESDLTTWAALIEKYPITKVKRSVPGGKERQDSVYNGIKVLDDNTSAVIVHDGARPFIEKDLVMAMLRELLTPPAPPLDKEEYGGVDGVIAAVPVKDTIKEARRKHLPPLNPPLAKGGTRGGEGQPEEIVVAKTLDRSILWAVQTPQIFDFRKIRDAHRKARSDNFYATDDAALIEKYGGKVKIVQGSYRNIKITTPEDIALAEAILKANPKS